MGVVGLPNVGKSTFFNILTKLQAAGKFNLIKNTVKNHNFSLTLTNF